jgi:hypothetical protein
LEWRQHALILGAMTEATDFVGRQRSSFPRFPRASGIVGDEGVGKEERAALGVISRD